MPKLLCPECGKELLPDTSGSRDDFCVCSGCGREVYVRSKTKITVKCAHCGKENETTVAR